LLHDFLFSVGSHSLKFQLVRKFQGRSRRRFAHGRPRRVRPGAPHGARRPISAPRGNAYNRILSCKR
ncbi:hypothetical protein, partial [Burkholderia pseudomallei]|uniref:hypothetical protein n=1 Tax=Burkholderia pseudomallei TaxID=28450 RepID=UPI0011C403DD